MEDLQRLYPIGIQTFSKIREGNYLYIDKTEYVYRMTHSASSYMFLSRPRRFGKSLLTSTLHSYFSGRKELFHGLAMEKLEKEWTEYPVLHFDMSMAKHVDKGGLERLLDFMLAEYERTFAINAVEGDANLRLVNLIKRAYEQTGKKVVVLIDEYDALEKEWTEYPVLHFDMSTAKHADSEQLLQELNLKLYGYEQIYGRLEEEVNPNQRLMGLIKRAYEQTGKKVVVLIDEYDAPLLDVVHERENLDVLRNIMRNFYSPLKACDPYLRYVFLTGITKFSQLSIFSELNNIKNISMDEPYAAICGISEDEICLQMKDDLGGLAKKLEITPEEALMKLKENYDGYHFTSPSPDIYNPFSLLNAFADGKFGSYWFGSGT
ncbi:ATP-binding protein, partial [Bacteroides ovatus]|uniref:ATP-binding protein n=1 Tax=Bacteroides ovatus TaxID=28116 RepID=UPI0015FAE23D